MSAPLSVRDLSLRAYDERALLEGVSFEVPAAGTVRLLGRSGLGKTTLLRALAALHPSAGSLCLGDDTPASLGRPRWRRRVTLIAQRPRLFGGDVEANLRRPFGYQSAEGEYESERAEAMLDALDLPDDVMTREARTLSVGEQQRVCLVRGLLHRPAFALLDEPTSALDPESRSAVRALLEREREAGVGLVLVGHDDTSLDATTIDLEGFRA
jgi:putative ABC transport system ATP-binding protein